MAAVTVLHKVITVLVAVVGGGIVTRREAPTHTLVLLVVIPFVVVGEEPGLSSYN